MHARAAPLLAVFSLIPSRALAEFAVPPGSEVAVADGRDFAVAPWSTDAPSKDSSVRVHIGPALDLMHGHLGFHAALDVGRSAGFRAATSFVALGSNGGAAILSGE